MGSASFGRISNGESDYAGLDDEHRILTRGLMEPQYNTAFDEMAVAEYRTAAAWQFPYNISTINYVQTVTNDGSIVHDASMAVLHTGIDAAGSAELMTRLPMRYIPGVGGRVRFTAIFTEGVANSKQGQGYGNHEDGLFFGFVGSQFGVIRLSGSTEFFTPQSSWSEGVFDAFDPEKNNVYQIQFQWLGGGELRFFIEDPTVGGFVLVHRIKYAGSSTEVSIENPSLPIIAFVENDGNTSDVMLKTASAGVGLEGNDDTRALRAAGGVEREVTLTAGVLTPIVSIRAPITYESKANRLSIFIPVFSISAVGVGNANARFKLFISPTLTGESWVQPVPGGSPAEYDVSATGTIIDGEFVGAFTISTPGNAIIPIGTWIDARLVPGEWLTIAAISSKSNVEVDVAVTFDAEV